MSFMMKSRRFELQKHSFEIFKKIVHSNFFSVLKKKICGKNATLLVNLHGEMILLIEQFYSKKKCPTCSSVDFTIKNC